MFYHHLRRITVGLDCNDLNANLPIMNVRITSLNSFYLQRWSSLITPCMTVPNMVPIKWISPSLLFTVCKGLRSVSWWGGREKAKATEKYQHSHAAGCAAHYCGGTVKRSRWSSGSPFSFLHNLLLSINFSLCGSFACQRIQKTLPFQAIVMRPLITGLQMLHSLNTSPYRPGGKHGREGEIILFMYV